MANNDYRGRPYAIRLSGGGQVRRVDAGLFHDWIERGFAKRPHPVRRPKYAVVCPQYVAWIERGALLIRRKVDPGFWYRLGPSIRTNSKLVELWSQYAVWTVWLSENERRWEIQREYGTSCRRKAITLEVNLGPFGVYDFVRGGRKDVECSSVGSV